MSETTIEWTATVLPDGRRLPGYTFNPWIGCTKVSVGPQGACEKCYAQKLARRLRVRWGAGEARRYASERYWDQPIRWNAKAEREGVRRRVFCASMADVFDNEVAQVERDWLWELIEETPHLDWLLLTKRVGNAASMLPSRWLAQPRPNVWLGATIANQEEADRDIPKLVSMPAAIRFLSCEPLLGPIRFNFASFMSGFPQHITRDGSAVGAPMRIHWVICGGESGHDARPMHPEWARFLRDQCCRMGVSFFFKQWGQWAPGECALQLPKRAERTATWWNGEWHFGTQTPTEECHRDDEPDLFALGKKGSGRTLDGRTWDEFPRVA